MKFKNSQILLLTIFLAGVTPTLKADTPTDSASSVTAPINNDELSQIFTAVKNQTLEQDHEGFTNAFSISQTIKIQENEDPMGFLIKKELKESIESDNSTLESLSVQKLGGMTSAKYHFLYGLIFNEHNQPFSNPPNFCKQFKMLHDPYTYLENHPDNMPSSNSPAATTSEGTDSNYNSAQILMLCQIITQKIIMKIAQNSKSILILDTKITKDKNKFHNKSLLIQSKTAPDEVIVIRLNISHEKAES